MVVTCMGSALVVLKPWAMLTFSWPWHHCLMTWELAGFPWGPRVAVGQPLVALAKFLEKHAQVRDHIGNCGGSGYAGPISEDAACVAGHVHHLQVA